MHDAVTRDELHRELENQFYEQRRWKFRNVLHPGTLASAIIAAIPLLITGIVFATNMQRDLLYSKETDRRIMFEQSEGLSRVSERIEAESQERNQSLLKMEKTLQQRIEREREERIAADNRIENHNNRALDDVNSSLRELTRDMKLVLKSLPRVSD